MALTNQQIAVLRNLKNKNPDLAHGFRVIFNNNIDCTPLKEAAFYLSIANNDAGLGLVETKIQRAITFVHDRTMTNKIKLSEDDVAHVMYALNYFRNSLPSHNFKNGQPNHYQLKVEKKLKAAVKMGAEVGYSADQVTAGCYNDKYKIAGDPNFRMLDETRIDALMEGFSKKYSQTHSAVNRIDFTQVNGGPGVITDEPVQIEQATATDVARMKKIINDEYGADKLNYDYIENNTAEFFNMVGKIANENDKRKIAMLTLTIKHQILAEEKSMEAKNNSAEEMTYGK